jgi:tight adherence protein B
MSEQFWIVALLLLLVCAAAVTLLLDRRQRSIDRQVAIALPASHADIETSIRRLEMRSRAAALQRLVNYRPAIPYFLHPIYVVLIGGLVAAVIFYANRLFGYSTLSVSIVAGGVALMVVRGLFGWQQRRFATKLFQQLPDTIQLVTSTVRSGLPVQEAFRTIAREMPEPTAGQFKIVCSELALGRPAPEVVEGIYRRTQVPEYAIFAVTLGVQLKSGGSLSETLLTLGDTVTQRVALAARAKALAGEVIFSSRALSVAPVIVGGLLYMISPSNVDLLFSDPTGQRLLAYAVGSVVCGHFVIKWMIRRETALRRLFSPCRPWPS